ncbi:hypothetical protein MSM1_01445 [Mycobacterium sp. SM1]|uniref:hypothetical protein n=1 Tax=Mycobacterium sp. SM1 TaxID=2816243 RepID=UPI001BCE1703|nr:hypothetical protein [Mycobacterium sp. SM1]MBS4727084.1 hypothetical protein [Mycobacterium sp. SM1]
MSPIRTLLRTAAVVAGSSATVVVGGLWSIAHADPAPPAPVPNVGEQLVNTAANAPQMLQSLATALGATPPAPPAPPPLASAAIRVPQPAAGAVPGTAAAIPGATSAVPGATSAVPGITSAVAGGASGLPGLAAVPGSTAAAPAAGPAQLLPSAQVNLPAMPFLPTPLPQRVSFPGDLAAFVPGMPASPGTAQPSTVGGPPVGAAPASSAGALLLPLSGLP